MKFCPLCYGNIEHRAEDFKVCKRCESLFDANGELIEQHNAHMAPQVAAAIEAGALPLQTMGGEVSALCGTCGERITKDTLTGTSCACAKRVAMRDLVPVATEAFTVMRAEDSDLEYVAVETLTRNKTTGEVTLSRIPLSQWPEWAAQLRMVCHGF